MITVVVGVEGSVQSFKNNNFMVDNFQTNIPTFVTSQLFSVEILFVIIVEFSEYFFGLRFNLNSQDIILVTINLASSHNKKFVPNSLEIF